MLPQLIASLLLTSSSSLAFPSPSTPPTTGPAPSPFHNYTEPFQTTAADGQQESVLLPGQLQALYYNNIQNGGYHYASSYPIGIAPHSFPWLATFSDSTTSNGKHPFNMTAHYKGSNVSSFELKDFWAGCVGTANLTAMYEAEGIDSSGTDIEDSNYPQNCTITVKGYRDDLKFAAPEVAKFEYRPVVQINPHVGAHYAYMQHFVLPDSFFGLRSAVFTAKNDSGIAVGDPAVSIDDVSYITTVLS